MSEANEWRSVPDANGYYWWRSDDADCDSEDWEIVF